MESKVEDVKQSAMTIDQLKSTAPPEGQEWCAYTYLLLPEPKNDIFGVIKILCYGRTRDEVDTILQAMFDSDELEHNIPFIRVRPTGKYSYIVPGNDPHAEKAAYNTETQEYVNAVEDKVTTKRKEQARGMRRRMKKLQEEAQDEEEDDPNSYEVYAHHRVKAMSIKSWLSSQEKVLKEQKKHMVESTKKFQDLERRFPKYKRQFNEELKGNVAEEEANEKEELTEANADVPQEEQGKGKEEASEWVT